MTWTIVLGIVFAAIGTWFSDAYSIRAALTAAAIGVVLGALMDTARRQEKEIESQNLYDLKNSSPTDSPK